MLLAFYFKESDDPSHSLVDFGTEFPTNRETMG